MAKKAKRAEPQTKKATTAAAKPAKAKTVKAKPAKRAASPRSAKNTNSKPAATTNPAAPKYASLEEARSATIDALLATIEDAEDRLNEAKRADSIDRLEKIGGGLA